MFGQSSLLSKDGVGWEGLVDNVNNPLFRLVVGVRDQINDLFMLNAKTSTR